MGSWAERAEEAARAEGWVEAVEGVVEEEGPEAERGVVGTGGLQGAEAIAAAQEGERAATVRLGVKGAVGVDSGRRAGGVPRSARCTAPACARVGTCAKDIAHQPVHLLSAVVFD